MSRHDDSNRKSILNFRKVLKAGTKSRDSTLGATRPGSSWRSDESHPSAWAANMLLPCFRRGRVWAAPRLHYDSSFRLLGIMSNRSQRLHDCTFRIIHAPNEVFPFPDHPLHPISQTRLFSGRCHQVLHGRISTPWSQASASPGVFANRPFLGRMPLDISQSSLCP